MTFALRQNHLTMHFSQHIPIVKRRMAELGKTDIAYWNFMFIVTKWFRRDISLCTLTGNKRYCCPHLHCEGTYVEYGYTTKFFWNLALDSVKWSAS